MPVIELTLTIRPSPRARIPGSTALTMSTAPKKLVSNRARTSASSPSSTADRYPYPALLTSTSTPPNAASAAATAAATWARSVTSSAAATARPGWASTRSRTASGHGR